MPRFIDYHTHLPAIPPEMLEQLSKMMLSGEPDELGVKPANAFLSKDGQAWCLTEAPDAEAVRKWHQAKGIPFENAFEVKSVV